MGFIFVVMGRFELIREQTSCAVLRVEQLLRYGRLSGRAPFVTLLTRMFKIGRKFMSGLSSALPALVCVASCAGVHSVVAQQVSHAVVGDYGFDASGMDPAVRPGDDFNQFANGAWISRTSIPADRSTWGVWDVLDEQGRMHVRDILESAARSHSAPGSETRMIGDFYRTFMNEADIERRAAAPLKEQLGRIGAIRSYSALATAIGQAVRSGDSMPMTLFVFVDFKNPERYSAYVTQGGLGLPGRDYYLLDTQPMQAAQAAYLDYVRKLLRLAGIASDEADAATRAQAIFGLEHRLAQIQWSRAQLRDLAARYEPWPRSQYASRAPGFDWAAFFKAAGVAKQPMLVASVDSALVATAELVPTVPLPLWRDYLAIRVIDQHAPFLARAFVDAHFAFHGTALSGTPVQEERWKRGVRFTESALGEVVGELFVAKYFSPEAKASAREMVRRVLSAAAAHIEGLSWMSAQTKAKAREKVSAFDLKIGYPDKWRDYPRLHIIRGQAYQNALAADGFEYDRQLAKLGKPVDRTEWQLTPMAVNAYYNPTENEIVFPAAVLQPPFFDPHADAAINYGGIGAIIGHEISHAFDDQGRLFDARGALTDWWTEDDAAKYKERTAALVAQYGAYEILPGLHLDGQLTLGENIADNAGLVIAYDAYHASLQGQAAPVIDGRSGDQRFFLSFAQVWRTLIREPILRQWVITNPHTPDPLRVRAVRNFDPWYAAFEVAPDRAQYLAPADRVRIW